MKGPVGRDKIDRGIDMALDTNINPITNTRGVTVMTSLVGSKLRTKNKTSASWLSPLKIPVHVVGKIGKGGRYN